MTLAQGPGVSGEVLKGRAEMLGILSELFGEFRGFPLRDRLGVLGAQGVGEVGWFRVSRGIWDTWGDLEGIEALVVVQDC